jgi:chromosome segregation ATPase
MNKQPVSSTRSVQQLKRQFLELLRQDEEFKLAVRAYLELEDVKTSLDRLPSVAEKLVEAALVLEASVKAHSERISALERAVNALREVAERHERRLMRTERDMRAVRAALDRLSASLEEEANDVVQHLLRQRGFNIATAPERFDKKYEFDIYGTDGRVTVIGGSQSKGRFQDCSAGSRADRRSAKALAPQVSRKGYQSGLLHERRAGGRDSG